MVEKSVEKPDQFQNSRVRRNKPLNFCLSNDWKKKTRTFQSSDLNTARLSSPMFLQAADAGRHHDSRCCFLVYIALFFTHSTIPSCGTIQLDFFKRWLSLSKKNLVLFKNITYQETNKELTICEGHVISVLKSEYRNLPPLMNQVP